MADVQEKVNRIRTQLGELTGEQASEIAKWEKSIKTHELYIDWCKHPVTKKVFDKLFEDLAGFNTRLSTDEELLDVERRAIFKVKDVLLWFLTLPKANAKALETIEKNVDEAIAEVEDYQSQHVFNRQ